MEDHIILERLANQLEVLNKNLEKQNELTERLLGVIIRIAESNNVHIPSRLH